MTKEELEHIQNLCRQWLTQPGTGADSHLTIPQSGALTRTVELEVKALLTFDNVLIKSAVDVDTGAKYTGLIRQLDGTEEFVDTPFEMIAELPLPPARDAPASPPLRATQRRYREAIDPLAERQRDRSNDFDPLAGFLPSLDEEPSAAHEVLPRYLVYTGAELLGYTLLERVHSAGERSGRFFPSEDYFNYADIFGALPDAENDYLEESVKTAYGLNDDGIDEDWKKFGELSAQVEALALFVQTEDGQRMDASEVRLMDLSQKYDDQTERWLYITLDQQATFAEFSD